MLNVQVVVSQNAMLGEKIATARLVNQQSLSFDQFCDYVAEGSTVTAADVSAVMKRLETVLPMVLSLNARVVVSPYGLTFRPTVRGSITQSQLKAKLELKKAELVKSGELEAADKIDVNRELKASDLAVSDLLPIIEVTLPSKWSNTFQQIAEFKRVTKAELSDGGTPSGDTPSDEQQAANNGQQTPSGDNTSGDNQQQGGGTTSDDEVIE